MTEKRDVVMSDPGQQFDSNMLPPVGNLGAGEGSRVLMRVRNLHKAFDGQIVLDGVSLDLHEGEVVLLRGDNGSGKTTLLNILTGNLAPDTGSMWLDADGSEERFCFPFEWWQELNPFNHFSPERIANEAVGRTWQDTRLFQTMSLLENLAVAAPDQPGENPFVVLTQNGKTRRCEEGNRCECRDLLASLGLKDRNDSSAAKISLGQMKRVAIARAVRGGARILFLDEPLSGLDDSGIDEVLDLLTSLMQRERVTVVIVEHVFNMRRILNLAKTVWTLRDGKITAEAASHAATELEASFSSVLQKLLGQFVRPGHRVHEHSLYNGATLFRITGEVGSSRSSSPVLDVRSLAVRRNGRLIIGHQLTNGAVQGLSLELSQADVVILYAPNGWGKSTLFESLSGMIPATQGQVLLHGVDITHFATWKRSRLGLQFLSARNNLFPELTVSDFNALRQSRSSKVDHCHNAMRLVGSLSGGERQRLALANMPSQGAVVLADEPFLGLDSGSITIACRQLVDFVDKMSGTLFVALPAVLNHCHA
jgi:branched-chain amino acid transport system ATP-binding protein/neutral amino acid transport system ATP-binding protein